MTSYLQSLTSHYTSLKRLLPNSLSADADLHIGDVDDSHVTRVLRAYYTEKGRPFPPWLPPDPNAPQKAPPAMVGQSQNNYGGFASNPGAPLRGTRSAPPGGLDDLFGAPGGGPAAPPPQQQQPPQPSSMRARARGLPSQPGPRAGPEPTARPLPSQRHGSNQSRSNFDFVGQPQDSMAPAPSREQSAAERLKARMRAGGGPTSPVPPLQQQQSAYDRPPAGGGNDRGGGGGYNQSDGRSGGSSRNNPYQSAPQDRYGGGGGGGGGRPYTGAAAPWMADDGYGGGGNGYSARGPGLPSNPRRR